MMIFFSLLRNEDETSEIILAIKEPAINEPIKTQSNTCDHFWAAQTIPDWSREC